MNQKLIKNILLVYVQMHSNYQMEVLLVVENMINLKIMDLNYGM